MKVAFATTDGKQVDEHFGRAGMFAIYEITRGGSQFLGMRKFADGMDKAVVDTRDMGPLHDSAVENKVDRSLTASSFILRRSAARRRRGS